TAAAVAGAGAIGFVGLVIPHLARRLVGARHRVLIPAAALLGALLLLWADAFARVVMQPQELPIGVITAAIGAPFLLVLVRRLHARTGCAAPPDHRDRPALSPRRPRTVHEKESHDPPHGTPPRTHRPTHRSGCVPGTRRPHHRLRRRHRGT